eukprot:1141613-Pelagomonas_calceolata.AAC.2
MVKVGRLQITLLASGQPKRWTVCTYNAKGVIVHSSGNKGLWDCSEHELGGGPSFSLELWQQPTPSSITFAATAGRASNARLALASIEAAAT